MDFKVVFKSRNKSKLAETIGQPGIDILDLIREEKEEYKELSCNNINFDSRCPIGDDTYNLSISEDYARKTGLFHGRTEVVVLVDSNNFSKFVKIDIEEKFERDYIGKRLFNIIPWFGNDQVIELYRLDVDYKVDKELLCSDWKDAGYPLHWDIN